MEGSGLPSPLEGASCETSSAACALFIFCFALEAAAAAAAVKLKDVGILGVIVLPNTAEAVAAVS
jgi:hypothetical protein